MSVTCSSLMLPVETLRRTLADDCKCSWLSLVDTFIAQSPPPMDPTLSNELAVDEVEFCLCKGLSGLGLSDEPPVGGNTNDVGVVVVFTPPVDVV